VWERNRFVEARPALRATIESPYVRGGVTGVGVITALAGLAELAGVIASRSRRAADAPPGESPKPHTG
jgi:hypothetical protein